MNRTGLASAIDSVDFEIDVQLYTCDSIVANTHFLDRSFNICSRQELSALERILMISISACS